MSLTLTILFWGTGLFWIYLVVNITWGLMTLRRLESAEVLGIARKRPRVSVVVPARDEGARIGQTVRRLFAQREIELQVIVVDDRSKDATPAVLEGLRGEFPGMDVVRVEALPEGWIGKCHAIHVGAARATGEWLLFSDGDIHLAEDVIARAVAAGEQAGVQHVTLTPVQCAEAGEKFGALYQSVMLCFGMFLSIHLGRANRDKKESMAGIGAFNMIRAETHRAIKGHEQLRLEVADDMKLGLLVRRAGGKSRTYIGGDEVQCDWAASVRGVIKALEKNMFAAAKYNVVLALGPTVVFAAISVLSVIAFFYLPAAAAIAAAGGIVLYAATGVANARLNRWPVLAGLLTPVGLWIIFYAGWNSAIKTLRQGGIRWRDTFYPIEQLRQGQVPWSGLL